MSPKSHYMTQEKKIAQFFTSPNWPCHRNWHQPYLKSWKMWCQDSFVFFRWHFLLLSISCLFRPLHPSIESATHGRGVKYCKSANLFWFNPVYQIDLQYFANMSSAIKVWHVLWKQLTHNTNANTNMKVQKTYIVTTNCTMCTQKIL